jgi:hypothetical protein
MSKGSTPRARQVSREEYERRWERAFGLVEQAEAIAFARFIADPQGEAEHAVMISRGVREEIRALSQADGDPGDDYAVERAGA